MKQETTSPLHDYLNRTLRSPHMRQMLNPMETARPTMISRRLYEELKDYLMDRPDMEAQSLLRRLRESDV